MFPFLRSMYPIAGIPDRFFQQHDGDFLAIEFHYCLFLIVRNGGVLNTIQVYEFLLNGGRTSITIHAINHETGTVKM